MKEPLNKTNILYTVFKMFSYILLYALLAIYQIIQSSLSNHGLWQQYTVNITIYKQMKDVVKITLCVTSIFPPKGKELK